VRLYEGSDLIATSSQTSLSQTHTFSDGIAPGTTYSVDVYDAVTETVVATETDIEPQAAAATVTASETATTVTLNVVLTNYCDTSDFVTVSLYKGADTTADPVYSATQTSATQDHVATDLVPSTTYTYVVYDTLMSAELAKDAVETGANTASVDSVDLAATRGMVTVSVDYYSEELGLYLQVTSTTPGDVAVGSSFDSDSLMYYFDISAGKSYVFTVYSGWDGSTGTVMLTSDEYAAPTAYIGESDVPNTAVWNLTGAYGAVSLYIYTSSDGANPDSDVPVTMYELSSGSGSVDLTTLDGVTSGNYYIKVYSTTHSEVLPTSAGGDATCIVYVSSS